MCNCWEISLWPKSILLNTYKFFVKVNIWKTINFLTRGMQQTFLHLFHHYTQTLQERIHFSCCCLNNRNLPAVVFIDIISLFIFDVSLNVNDAVSIFFQSTTKNSWNTSICNTIQEHFPYMIFQSLRLDRFPFWIHFYISSVCFLFIFHLLLCYFNILLCYNRLQCSVEKFSTFYIFVIHFLLKNTSVLSVRGSNYTFYFIYS